MTPPDAPAAAPPEMSRLLPLERLDREGSVEVEIVADAAECAALAARFDLVAIQALSATLRVRRTAIGDVVMTGTLKARPVYVCVVTVEPFVGSVEESFALRFAPPGDDAPTDRSAGPEDEDQPEALVGDALELGETVAQQLALTLDPHPRAPAASLDEEAAAAAARIAGAAVAPVNPFAALERLRRGD
ncbi:MAG: DUF177 domain-containing protein [Alphaproteobacteria bacterium]|nr:DUF177 domain-containing protein [Alphaproteobacteria bacterium]